MEKDDRSWKNSLYRYDDYVLLIRPCGAIKGWLRARASIEACI
jgi:hypothetical protein